MSYQQFTPDPRMQSYPQQPDPRMQGYPQQPDPRMQGYPQPFQQPGQPFVQSNTEIIKDDNQGRINSLDWTTHVVKFLFGLLEVMLLLRFIFRLLAANPYSAFVALLYNCSYPFVALFQGIFGDPSLRNGTVIEVTTLIAMIVYALIAWGLIALVKIILAPSLSGSQRITTTQRNRYF